MNEYEKVCAFVPMKEEKNINPLERDTLINEFSFLLSVLSCLNQDIIFQDNSRANVLHRIAEARTHLDQLEKILKLGL